MRIPVIDIGKKETRLDLGYVTIWFSYNTMVAFRYSGGELHVSVNYWSNTTGKLINRLQPDKKQRLNSCDLEQAWNAGPVDPIHNLALSALNGDNMAIDAIKDAIKS